MKQSGIQTGSAWFPRTFCRDAESRETGWTGSVRWVAWTWLWVMFPSVAAGQDRPAVDSTHFALGQDCALCHSNSFRAVAMRDQQQRGVAPYDLWQSSMMANSARDPFWRAVVSAEAQATPSRKAMIEEKCTRCHAPMAGTERQSAPGEILAFLQGSSDQARLGADGVSCVVCHQIEPDGLGEPSSFTGHFQLNRESKIYGPHRNPVTMPMQRHVGFTPTHGDHISQSSLCASCHTLLTRSVDADGVPTVPGDYEDGNFHEQAPYLEWRNSVFDTEGESPASTARSCQDCHVPTTDEDGQPIATRLAHNPGGRDFPFLEDRRPYGRHLFVGSNTLLLQILRDHSEDLGVTASPRAFDATIQATRQFLQKQTADLELGQVHGSLGHLRLPVIVRNLAGHKLPTAYPSRRLFLQVRIQDAAGETRYLSGVWNSRGQLVDQQGKVLASERAGGPILPHQTVVTDPQSPQVYESIMADAEGRPTFTLLRGARFLKDNRLLPQGWAADHPDAAILAPVGLRNDGDFIGGRDQVEYQFALPTGTYQVTGSLYFQVIAPRHAEELFQHDTPQVAEFRRYYEAADLTPELLVRKTKSLVVAPALDAGRR